MLDELQGGAVTRTYSYGLELINERQTIAGTLTTSFYGYDGHGSVRFLTDSTGAITDTYDYDAFGNLISSTGSTPNNYLFAGEQFDQALGIYYNRARYYDQRQGRFWTMDTFEGDPGSPASLHRYLYANADPANKVDPSGEDSLAEVIRVSSAILTLAALTLLTLHALHLGPGKGPEIPIRVNHYTQWRFVTSILRSGLNRPVNYVTTDWYFTGKTAKAKLALSLKPQVMINFFAFKNGDLLTGPNFVEPANGEPGGGTEYYTDFPVPVSSRAPAIIPLF